MKKFAIIAIFALSLVVKSADSRHSRRVERLSLCFLVRLFRTIIIFVAILFIFYSFLAVWFFLVILFFKLFVPIIMIVTILIIIGL